MESSAVVGRSGRIAKWRWLFCLPAALCFSDLAAVEYEVVSFVDLGTLGGFDSTAYDINEAGHIVGESYDSSGTARAFRWHNGVISNLGGMEGAYGINEAGDVAGIIRLSVNGHHPHRAASFNNGVVTDLGSLDTNDDDSYSYVTKVNDLGVMIGGSDRGKNATFDGTPTRAIRYQNGAMSDLGAFWINDGAVSVAKDINNAGQVVGHAENEFRQFRPFLLQPGVGMIDLGTLGGGSGSANAINQWGEIVGTASLGFTYHAFIRRNGVMTQLPGVDFADSSAANDINDDGLIVGSLRTDFPRRDQAFFHDGTTMYVLDGMVASHLGDGVGEGIYTLTSANAINNHQQIVGVGKYCNGQGDKNFVHGFLINLAPVPPKLSVFNANRHGDPAARLAGVTVTFTTGAGVVAGSAVTDADGVIGLDELDLGLGDSYDIKLEKGESKRVYQGVTPQQVVDDAVKLVLPVLLHEKLAVELPKVQATGLLVLDYDIDRALGLVTLRNSLLPESAAAHQEHDLALARLLITAESMSRIYAAVEPLAKDAGKLLADNLVAFLAVKDAAADAASAVASELVASELSTRVRAFAISAVLASLKHTTDVAQKALVQGSQSLLPPWGAELVNQSSSTIIAGVLGALSSGAWDSQKGKSEGRKKLLENLAKLLGEQVGGRIIASAHVAQTQQDFTLAEVRARGEQGSGDVSDAFIASLNKAIEVEIKADEALGSSALIDDTATKFGYVADYADVVGKIPAAQIASLMARLIKVLNLGLVVKAVTDDFSTLADISFVDTPAAAELAFFPFGMGGGGGGTANDTLASAPETPEVQTAAALPTGFATSLGAFRAAVVAADAEAALTAGENMISLNVTLEEQIEAALLQTRARALSASPANQALNDAYSQLQDAVVALRAALAELYPAMAGHLAPPIADPAMTTAGLLVLIDDAAGALSAYENAETAAQAAGSGITAPALVVTLTHGLINTEQATRTQPGPASLRARIFNAGDVGAENVTVELVLEPATGPVHPFSLSTAAVASVGTLAPGQSVDVTWSGIATDVSGSGIGSVAAYTFTIQANGARAEGAGGGFEVVSEQSTFAEWVAGFSGLGGQNGFTDDPDLDGLQSGLEKFFGLHPGDPAGFGLRLLSGSGGLPLLEHTRAPEFGSDATTTYEWSLDLRNWHPSGALTSGVSVLLNPEVISGVGAALKTVRIVPQVAGQPDRLFYRLNLTAKAPVLPEPLPTPPQITAQPVLLNVTQGQPATFSVIVTGTGPILYQWQKNGVDILGAISSNYQIASASASHQGTYTVRIVAPGGSVMSTGAALSVESGGGGD
jgi:probable HAF family extracellular repeat protein